MKKLSTSCIVICFVSIIAISPSYAANSDSFENPNVTVYSLYYQTASAYLSISSSGMATAKGIVVGYAGKTTKITIHLYLQKYSDGKWIIIDDWTKSNNATNLTYIQQKQISKGYKYRVKASCIAYFNTKSESINQYSPTVTY